MNWRRRYMKKQVNGRSCLSRRDKKAIVGTPQRTINELFVYLVLSMITVRSGCTVVRRQISFNI